MSTTQVTIEDLGSISMSAPEPQKKTAPAPTPAKVVTAHDVSPVMPVISDLGEVTLAPPQAVVAATRTPVVTAPKVSITAGSVKAVTASKQTSDQVKPVATDTGLASKAIAPAKPTALAPTRLAPSDDVFYDPLTGEAITPLEESFGSPANNVPVKLAIKPDVKTGAQVRSPETVKTVDKVNATPKTGSTGTLDVEAALKTLTAEYDRLHVFADITLDKDDFVPDLTAILDVLSTPREEYTRLMAHLDHILTDKDKTDETAQLAAMADKADKQRAALCTKIDKLLISFTAGNNWYRVLAAWELFHRDRFRAFVAKKSWCDTLSHQAATLLTDTQKADLVADADATIPAADSLKALAKSLDTSDTPLSADQKTALVALLMPVWSQISVKAKQKADKPATVATQETTLQPTAPVLPAGATDQDQQKVAALQSAFDMLESSHESEFSRIKDNFAAANEKLARLEQIVNEKMLTVTQETTQSLTKLTAKLDAKLEKEKTAATARDQQLKDQLVKQQQDFKLKITSVDETLSTFKKLQATRDQDQNKKLTVITGEIEDLRKNAGKQIQVTDSNLSRARQDVEERLHQFARQLTEIKSDQMGVNQVQTSALAQLAAEAQNVKSTLTGYATRLQQLETTTIEIDSLKNQVTDQLQNLTVRVQTDLDSNRLRIDKISAQVAELQSYASRLETENEELRISNAGLKQENWQARRQLGLEPGQPVPVVAEPAPVVADAPTPLAANPITATAEPVATFAPASAAAPSAPQATADTQPLTVDAIAAVSAPEANDLPAPQPAPTQISNLAKLGITTSRLTADSRLLTHQPLDFLRLNLQLAKALTGLNSFSDWLHAQAAPAPTPVYQAESTPVAPAVSEIPVSNITAPGPQAFAPASNADYPAVNSNPTVTAIPSIEPINPYANSIPVPPPSAAADSFTPQSNSSVGNSISRPEPDAVVLPFMS